MKHSLGRFRLGSVMIVLALISAACYPIPNLPSGLTPTARVFVPGLAHVEPGLSPLQPTLTPIAAAPPPVTGVAPPETAPVVQATDIAPATAPSATPEPSLVGPLWQWVSSTFSDGTALAPGDPTRYSFQLLGEGNATVQADCNFGSGTYEALGDSFSFGAIGTTKMACPPDSLDSAFLAQLRNIASYTFDAGDLVIALKDGAGEMRLRAAAAEPVAEARPATTPSSAAPTVSPTGTRLASPTPLPTAPPTAVPPGTPVPTPANVVTATVLPALGGTSWFLVSLTANDRAIPPMGPTPLTLEIDANGSRISGSTGCNQYRATFRKDSSGATVLEPALTTQNACAANLMVQEVEFVDALLRARSYVVQGNELRLIDAAGKGLLVFARK